MSYVELESTRKPYEDFMKCIVSLFSRNQAHELYRQII